MATGWFFNAAPSAAVDKNAQRVATQVFETIQPQTVSPTAVALNPASLPTSLMSRAVAVVPRVPTLAGGALVAASDGMRGAVTAVGHGAANLAASTGLVVSNLARTAGQCVSSRIPGFLGAPTTAGAAGTAGAGAAGAAGAAEAGAAGTFSSMFSEASNYAGHAWSALSWGNTIVGGFGVLTAVYLAYKYLYPATGVNVTQNNNNNQTVNLNFELSPNTEVVQKKDADGTVHLSVKQIKMQEKQDERFALILKQALAEHAETMRNAATAATPAA